MVEHSNSTRGATVVAGVEYFKLWPNKPPGTPALSLITLRGPAEPIVAVHRPLTPDGRAVLCCPGGGYSSLSSEGEGTNIARALTPFGITVFVLDYRLPVDGWINRADVPLQDAQRAMRLIRSRAAFYAINPSKLGVIGFSSGGHLAASLATGYDDLVYRPLDSADRISARPAFTGLGYAVTTLSIVPPRSQSRRNLLGPNPTPALLARYNSDARVTRRTPPLFVLHAIDDTIVPYWMSTLMLAAARRANVHAELHLLERGGHGFGAGLPRDNPGSRWPEWFALWLRRATR